MKKIYITTLVMGILFVLANTATASAQFVCLLDASHALALPANYRALNATDCINGVANANGDWYRMAAWLVDGADITELLSTETIGELTLKEEKVPVLGEIEILCSVILDGTISPEGEGEVTELLSLTGVAISLTGLSGTALECTNVKNCPTPLVWGVSLPWSIGPAESTGAPLEDWIVILIARYESQCMGVIGEPSDTCKLEVGVGILENMTGGDLLETLKIEKAAECELAGANSGSIKTDEPALIQVLEGLELAVS